MQLTETFIEEWMHKLRCCSSEAPETNVRITTLSWKSLRDGKKIIELVSKACLICCHFFFKSMSLISLSNQITHAYLFSFCGRESTNTAVLYFLKNPSTLRYNSKWQPETIHYSWDRIENVSRGILKKNLTWTGEILSKNTTLTRGTFWAWLFLIRGIQCNLFILH